MFVKHRACEELAQPLIGEGLARFVFALALFSTKHILFLFIFSFFSETHVHSHTHTSRKLNYIPLLFFP